MKELSTSHTNYNIVFFDGECNLCQGTVQFLIKIDKKNVLKFASLQSNLGQELLRNIEMPTHDLKSLIFKANGKTYLKSTAVLRVFKEVGGLWFLIYLLIVFPKFLRDWVYDIVSKNRYNWFGKKEECWIPTKELMDRFIN